MTKRSKEVWARSIASAFSEIIPTWPKGYTRATSRQATFYTIWLADLGYRVWDCM